MRENTVHVLLSLLTAILLPVSGTALGQHTFRVALDTDNDRSTGCEFTVREVGGAQVLPGFEQVFQLTVDYLGGDPIVSSTSVQDCDPGNGTFGPPTPLGGGWSVGLDNGIDGSDVVEGELPAAPAGPVALALQSDSAGGGADAVASGVGGSPLLFFPPSLGIPTLSEWGLILLAALLVGVAAVRIHKRGPTFGKALSILLIAGVAMSALLAMFTADGSVVDWDGRVPIALDPKGDANPDDPNADIVAFFAAEGSLFFRIDVRNLEQGKLAFATSTTQIGDLGGLAGADAICNNLAAQPTSTPAVQAAAGSFVALMSTPTTDARDRLTAPAPEGWQTTCVPAGAIATSVMDLTDGKSSPSIACDETGNPLSPGGIGAAAWTGSFSNGTRGAFDCSGWSSTSGIGSFGRSDLGALFLGGLGSGADAHRIYCFEN